MDFVKRNELERIAADAMLLNQDALTVNQVLRPGSDSNVLVNAIAAMAEEVMRQNVISTAGSFYGSSKGQRLARLGIDRTGVAPKPAAPARLQAQFSTTAPAPVSFTIPVGTQLGVASGQQFITTQSTIFPAGATGPILVDAQSTLAGKDQQVAIAAGATTIPLAILSTITNAPGDLACASSAASAGADDAEQDDQYRGRLRAYPLTIEKGTRVALEERAKAVPGVRTATAIRVIDVLGRPQQAIELSVMDNFTTGLIKQGANPPAYQAQAQALASTVFQELQDTVADGAYLIVRVAQVDLLPITMQLRFVAGVDYSTVALIARMTTVLYTNSLKPGQRWVYADAIAQLRTVRGLAVQGDEIVSPSGDVVVGSGLEVIRTDPSITQTSVQTAADIGQLNLPSTVVTASVFTPPPVVTL